MGENSTGASLFESNVVNQNENETHQISRHLIELTDVFERRRSPLHDLVLQRKVDVLQAFLDLHSRKDFLDPANSIWSRSINEPDNFGRTPFHLSVVCSFPEILELLLRPVTTLSQIEPSMYIPLSDSTTHPPSDHFSFPSLSPFIIPDLGGTLGQVPLLHLAISNLRFPERAEEAGECFRLLLSLAATRQTDTPPPVAKEKPADPVPNGPAAGPEGEELIEIEDDQVESEASSLVNSEASVLPQLFVDLEQPDFEGYTALHLAARYGFSDVAEKLLAAGASVSAESKDCSLPVHCAIDSRDPTTFRLLLGHQAASVRQESETSLVSLLKRCVHAAAWRCLAVVMHDSEFSDQIMTDAEFQDLLESANLCGFATEFESVFKAVVEEKKVSFDGFFPPELPAAFSSTEEKPPDPESSEEQTQEDEQFLAQLSAKDVWREANNSIKTAIFVQLDSWKHLGRKAPRIDFDLSQENTSSRLCAASVGFDFIEEKFFSGEDPLLDRLDEVFNGQLRDPEDKSVQVASVALSHNRLPSVPENPSRMDVLVHPSIGILTAADFRDPGFIWKLCSRKASLADILRVHDWGYVKRVKEQSGVLFSQADQAKGQYGNLDEDTITSSGSWVAAITAARTAIDAVEAVCSGDCRNGIAIIRPPGHHVGSWGACQSPDGELDYSVALGSQGFCFFNNAAVAAAYAKYNFHTPKKPGMPAIRRIAIVDFDIHHGNGTQQIIMNTRFKPNEEEDDETQPYQKGLFKRNRTNGMRTLVDIPSANPTWGCRYSLKLEVDDLKIWKDFNDSEELFFGSIHVHGEDFYPGCGSDACYVGYKVPPRGPVETNPIESGSMQFESREIEVPFNSESEKVSTFAGPSIVNCGLHPKFSRSEFRRRFRSEICSHLIAFKPDLVVVSAGFDGHNCDTVNNGSSPLIEADFSWMTSQLVAVANTCCDGRIVSILEGGYNTRSYALSPLARCVAAHLRSLRWTSPAASLKNRHVKVETQEGAADLPSSDPENLRKFYAERRKRKRGTRNLSREMSSSDLVNMHESNESACPHTNPTNEHEKPE